MLSRCSGRLDRVGLGLELPAPFAPSVAERGLLAAREARLAAALSPASRDEAQRMVAIAFVGAIARDDGEETRQQIGVYAGELCRFPLFAVAAALRGYRDSGERFRPALGDLILSAKAACREAQAERAGITALLGAKVVAVPSEAERARVIAAFRERLRGLFEPQAGAPPQVNSGGPT